MGLREDLGGKLEEILNKAIDEHLNAEVLSPLIVNLLNGQLEKIKVKAKELVDKIDGEKDLV